jgi:hypothetical protein
VCKRENYRNPVEQFLVSYPMLDTNLKNWKKLYFVRLFHTEMTNNCTGQSYDKASNMAGIYIGLQVRITQLHPLANHVPCAVYLLNLVRACAAACVTEGSLLSSIMQYL